MAQQVQLPRLFTLLKWTFLVVIAVSTAIMGFLQSMLVASLYHMRSTFVYNIVVRAQAGSACQHHLQHAPRHLTHVRRTAPMHAPTHASNTRMHAHRMQSLHEAWVPKFFQWLGFNLALAFAASAALFLISPAASGSGIPDVKAYLNGVESPAFRNFFTIKTFVAKVWGSPGGGARTHVCPSMHAHVHLHQVKACIDLL